MPYITHHQEDYIERTSDDFYKYDEVDGDGSHETETDGNGRQTSIKDHLLPLARNAIMYDSNTNNHTYIYCSKESCSIIHLIHARSFVFEDENGGKTDCDNMTILNIHQEDINMSGNGNGGTCMGYTEESGLEPMLILWNKPINKSVIETLKEICEMTMRKQSKICNFCEIKEGDAEVWDYEFLKSVNDFWSKEDYRYR